MKYKFQHLSSDRCCFFMQKLKICIVLQKLSVILLFFLTKIYFVIVFLKRDIYIPYTLGALKIKKGGQK